DLRVPLMTVFEAAAVPVEKSMADAQNHRGGKAVSAATTKWSGRDARVSSVDLLAFFAERLKVYLREKGARHDLIDAVFSLGGQDDLALIVKRVEALGEFLKTDDGANLLAGVKRASNILAIEEKKDKRSYAGEPNGSLLQEPAERDLAA